MRRSLSPRQESTIFPAPPPRHRPPHPHPPSPFLKPHWGRPSPALPGTPHPARLPRLRPAPSSPGPAGVARGSRPLPPGAAGEGRGAGRRGGVARSVCGRGSHCLVNSCCCCTSASLPARARHEWPGPAAAAAAAAAAARSSQTQREVRGAPGAGGRASGAWDRGGGRARAGRGAARAGPGAPRAQAEGMGRRGPRELSARPGPPAGTRPPWAHCASAAPRGRAWPGAVSPAAHAAHARLPHPLSRLG